MNKENKEKKYINLIESIKIIETLRSENGCKWDREQTHKSLRTNILEEAYETVDAIDSCDITNLKEELGDVLLQVLLHSQIAKDNGKFDIEDVAKVLNEKLIRRHPHVFGDVKVNDSSDIIKNWEKIKKEEKKDKRKSLMDGISKSQSALLSALKISKKAVSVGFEWQNENQLYDCIKSEFNEFKDAKTNDDKEDEFGDILFAVVNLARYNKINPELALIRANKKFMARFKKMEELSNKPLETLSFEEYDKLWQNAKEILSSELELN